MSYAGRFNFKIPTEIRFGPGVISELESILLQFSGSVMIITFRSLKVGSLIRDKLVKKGFNVIFHNDVRPNPVTEDIDMLAELARSKGCKTVVAIGGGSAIDTAKIVALLATNEGNSWDYSIENSDTVRTIVNDPLPLIAVPTTAGTGAEVTHVAVLTNSSLKLKAPIVSTRMCPSYALIDPEITVTMPPAVTAATGFDAFTHAFERYESPKSFPFIDDMAFSAMSVVTGNLKTVMEYPEDINARSALAWASTQAGLCLLTSTGESGLHILSLPLSARFNVSHGIALAACIPLTLRILTEIRPNRIAALAGVLPEDDSVSIADLTIDKKCDFVIRSMESWLDSMGLMHRLSDFGVCNSDINDLASSISLDRLQIAWEQDINHKKVADLYREYL